MTRFLRFIHFNFQELEVHFGSQLQPFLNVFSGGGFASIGIFALGIVPYINASIVMQLATTSIPSLEKLQKEEGDTVGSTEQGQSQERSAHCHCPLAQKTQRRQLMAEITSLKRDDHQSEADGFYALDWLERHQCTIICQSIWPE